MIKGMTGFGTSSFCVGKIKGFIEVKSVNHRYLDLSFYLPVGFGAIENKIRDRISKELSRGRVTVFVRMTDKPVQEVFFNEEMIEEYLQHAKSIEKKYKLNNNLTLADLIRMPGVVDVKEVFVEASQMAPFILKSLDVALKGLKIMREREGKSLVVDIGDKLKKMTVCIKMIEKRITVILKEAKAQMKPEEFSSYQKSIDINEEIARFLHYITEMKSLLNSTVPVGKKLDFIAQEMQRETNTIGSKVQDEIVSNQVITMKSKIEKIREQGNNVE